MDEPEFSVVIPTFNRGSVADAVDTVLGQTYGGGFDVVVVDDASTQPPETPDDPRVKLIRRDVNGGSAAARNDGIRAARAPWVVFLDDDDRLRPQWLERVSTAIARHADWDIVTTEAEFIGPDGPLSRNVVQRDFPKADQLAELLFGSYLSVICAVRRDILVDAGGFDESLRTREDYELWLRLLRDGATAGLVPEVLAEVAAGRGKKSGDRETALRARIEVLDRTSAWNLSDTQRDAAASHIDRTRDELAIATARRALAEGRPARQLLWHALRKVSNRRDCVKIAAAFAAPRLARRSLERQPWD